VLGGVVRILRGFGGGAVFILGQQFLEPAADILEALAELAVRSLERALDATPAGVLDQDRLLGFGRRARFGSQPLGEFDRRDIVARLGLRAAAFG
jgi:hypothetical protein